jgi:hypothetical protein
MPVAGDDELDGVAMVLDGVAMFLDDGVDAVVGFFARGDDVERVMGEDEQSRSSIWLQMEEKMGADRSGTDHSEFTGA